MTKRNSSTRAGLPRLFEAEEVAAALGCSGWWVKEQARRRRIPFIRSGGGYRFTEAHFAEILRLLEERPVVRQQQSNSASDSPPSGRRPRKAQQLEPAVRLRPRVPRRARQADQSSAA